MIFVTKMQQKRKKDRMVPVSVSFLTTQWITIRPIVGCNSTHPKGGTGVENTGLWSSELDEENDGRLHFLQIGDCTFIAPRPRKRYEKR